MSVPFFIFSFECKAVIFALDPIKLLYFNCLYLRLNYILVMKNYWYLSLLVLVLVSSTSIKPKIGDVIDMYNGVPIFYNGKDFKHVEGRHIKDGYNLGLKYQCVEFVKRYYYEVYGHKMPNSYGHAKDFYDPDLGDKGYNKQRGLMQYTNIREYAPAVDDILVYGPHDGNPFGHVAIISEVGDDYIELVHQNKGAKPRIKIKLVNFLEYYTIADYNIKGWLRLE